MNTKNFFRKRIGIMFLLSVTALPLVAADDPVIMKINGKEVQASDFTYIYDKYHTNSRDQRMSVHDYVPLYVNFRLKIEEALSEKMDTSTTFKKELSGYRNQLSKQYLDPVRYADSIVKAVYDQSKEVVEVSRILIKTPLKSQPIDTLAAYERAMQIYNRLKKEPFDKVARDVSDEIDNPDLPGYFGWMFSTSAPQPIADEVYATPVGEYSRPFRTNKGYYIVKVQGKKPNPGEVLASHILLTVKEEGDDAIAKLKIDSLYDLLKNGADFAELAKEYSEDKGSAAKGGELPWFGIRSMVPEFEKEAYALTTPGDYSVPFKSRYGYHIVKLSAKRPYPAYDDVKESLTKYMMRTDRATDIKAHHLEMLKKIYSFKLNEDAYNRLLAVADIYYPSDSLFVVKTAEMAAPLFTIGDSVYTEALFLKNFKIPSLLTFSEDIVEDKLKGHSYELLLKEEGCNLESRFIDFKNLMDEYHDGMLLFEISNREVWNKAGKDTVGIEKFFNQHKPDYKWRDKKYKGVVVFCKDDAAKKRVEKLGKKLTVVNADALIKEQFADSVPDVKVIKGVFSKGDNHEVDQLFFGQAKNCMLPEGYSCYYAKGKMLAAPESYQDVRGIVISDYQEELERCWLETLTKKYPVEIYWDVIDANIR